MVFIVIGLVLVSTLAVIAGSTLYFNNAHHSYELEKATNIAEAGLDKAIAAINKTGGSYLGEQDTQFGDGAFSVTVTTKAGGTKLIESTGYIPNQTNPRAKRTITIEASKGVGVSFIYGVQIGEGGLSLGNQNTIQGSVYSNGNVDVGNTNNVTGDVWVAGGPQPTADQETDCTGGACADYIFGKNVSGEDRFDIAQSFTPGSSEVLNKIVVKLKKVGNPSDATVRILGDNNGKPNKNSVYASGTLYSSLVTGDYGWIDVTFNTLPNLNYGTVYWIVVDTSSNATNYWVWQLDNAQSYTNGQAKWSPNWQTGNPDWFSISGDLSFKTFLGGAATHIRAGNTFTIGGDAHANTIENVTVQNDAYFQSIINSTVNGTSFPGSADPPPKVFPISEANISQWKNTAEQAGVITGDIETCISNLNAGKIIGHVNLNSNCNMTVQTPIWITGNLTLGSNNILTLDSVFGQTSGIIIVDGIITLGSNNHLRGTGQGSSILVGLSTHDSRSDSSTAIAINSHGNSGVLYANNGILEPGNNNTFKELTGWGIRVINSSTINYETGLSSTIFSSGPSGSFTLIKGSYNIK